MTALIPTTPPKEHDPLGPLSQSSLLSPSRIYTGLSLPKDKCGMVGVGVALSRGFTAKVLERI